jgi:hypothetical protein
VPETKYTLPQAAAKIANALKEKLTNVEKEIRDLRVRELQPKEGSLAKHELCPLCGGPDRDGVCNCLRKNATMGYGTSTPGSATPSGTGMGDIRGAGTQPMAMSEKNPLSDKTKQAFERDPKKSVMPKGAYKNPTSKQGGGGRCSECGETGHGPSQHVKKADVGMSSTGALSKHNVNTPVSQVNQELGGFQSIAHNPTAMPAPGGPSLKPGVGGRKPISSMGRPTASAAGVIPHAKSEKEMKPVKAAPEKAAKGSKMPEAGDSVDAKKTGAGGQIKELRKDLSMPAATKKTPGIQPVGQGGGDKHKVVGPAAGYPNAKLPLAGVGGKGVPGPAALPSVDIDVSDFDMDSPKNKGLAGLKAAGRAEVKRMIGDKGASGNPNAQAAAADLKADKIAGGVGFLNALIRKFRPMPKMDPNVNPDGSINRTRVVSKRFHGALPLQRSESAGEKRPAPKKSH